MIRIAQLLLVVAALGLWVASRLPWAQVRSFDGLGPARTATVSGASWSTALVPLALLLLAAAVAALRVRGWVLRVLAVLVAAASAGAGYLAISQFVIRDVSVRAADLAQVPVVLLVGSERFYGGAAVTLAAAVATLLAAVLLMRGAVKADDARRRRPRKETAEQISERTMWDALDEGRDPTRDSDSEGR
ncbi:MAG TPA: TIGR02234 family membrane protein [Mycobacterium sp.]|nr:TIGR02234 family membrane protein [Mycobacterium sp.]